MIAGVLLPADADARTKRGSYLATWYCCKYERQRMANGETFYASDPTIVAAHPRTGLRLNTRVRLTNPVTGKQIIAVVRDRVPSKSHVALDLSEAGAIELGYWYAGKARLHVERLP